VPEPRTAAATRARWAGKTQADKDAAALKMRRALVLKELRAQIIESRRAQGLHDHVVDPALDELAREILGGDHDEAA
jgi:hypothetical protein